MPLTLVQRQTNVSGANVASLTGTYSPAPTSGRLLVAMACSDATLTMTSSGWTLATSNVSEVGLYEWYKIAGGAESATVTVTPSSSASTEIVIEEWSGNTATPLDKVANLATNSAGTTAATGTTTATAQADERAIAAFGYNDGGGVRTANSYTNSFVEVAEIKGAGTTATNLVVAEVDLAATGTQTTTMTLSASTASFRSALIATYMAAAVTASPQMLIMAPMR